MTTEETTEPIKTNEQWQAEISERKQTEEALEWEARVNASIAELSRLLLLPTSLEDISQMALRHAQQLTRSQFGFVGYIDPETGYLIAPTMTRDIWEICQVENKSPVFEEFGGLWGWVLENRTPILTNNPAQDPRSSGVPEGHLPISSCLSVPALIGETLVGQITLANSATEYTERDLDLVEHLANLYALAIQRKRADDELWAAKEAAEAANRAKSQFLANISHELRTPLNGILGYAQLLQQDENLAPDSRHKAASIHQNGEYLLTLINDILDLSKGELGQMELNRTDFQLPSLLKPVVEFFSFQAQQSDLTFEYWVDPDLPRHVRGDKIRLRQVLVQLLDNAIKFTSQGQIVFKVSRRGSRVRFEIQDTGVGISTTEIDHITASFYQSASITSGTGLGLSLTQRLVTMMGGELHIESLPEQGSHFWFELEFVPGEVAELFTEDSFPKPKVGGQGDGCDADIQAPSPEVVEDLFSLAMIGDVEAIQEQARRLTQEDPAFESFARQLSQLAKRFQIGKIRDFLKPHLE